MNPKTIRIEDYDYCLPDDRIARHPLPRRDACKLLTAHRSSADRDTAIVFNDDIFSNIGNHLPPGATLVANDTRVINARIVMHKPGGARIEIFCLEPHEPADYESSFGARGHCSWKCLVGNAKRWKEGSLTTTMSMSSGTSVSLRATRTHDHQIILFDWSPAELSFSEVIAAVGEIPIPPYLNRPSEATDAEDYQTVYSHVEGSVAAPTAGLHFTRALLDKLDTSSFKRLEVTLHVGAGTFKPVKSDTIGDHDMHSEFICVSRDVIAQLANSGVNNIIAVGTTSVRTLESIYHIGRLIKAGLWHGEVGQWVPYDTSIPDIAVEDAFAAVLEYLDAEGTATLMAHTKIIIVPGYRYRIIDGMITNFHQPKSTLLLLVSAFLGDNVWRNVYAHALASGYRFLSYGDACLFLK